MVGTFAGMSWLGSVAVSSEGIHQWLTMALSGMNRSPRTNTNLEVMFTAACLLPRYHSGCDRGTLGRGIASVWRLMTDMARAWKWCYGETMIEMLPLMPLADLTEAF